MNFRVDIIIVGDSKSGHDILDKVATGRATRKVAFISKTFKSNTTHDYVNVTYFNDEVVYLSYRHSLFCCYTKNGDHIYGTHLVMAPGLNYEPFIVNNEPVPCVFNSVDDVAKSAKDQPALVICKSEADVKLAIDVAKKYKQVYACTDAVSLHENVSAATARKLAKVENLVILTNTNIKSVTETESMK